MDPWTVCAWWGLGWSKRLPSRRRQGSIVEDGHLDPAVPRPALLAVIGRYGPRGSPPREDYPRGVYAASDELVGDALGPEPGEGELALGLAHCRAVALHQEVPARDGPEGGREGVQPPELGRQDRVAVRDKAQVPHPEHKTRGALADILNYLSIISRYSDFLRGVISSQNVIYYLSVIAVALFLATRALETRRWA